MKKQISLLLVAVALNLSNGAQAASLSSTRRALNTLFRQAGQAVSQSKSGLSQDVINAVRNYGTQSRAGLFNNAVRNYVTQSGAGLLNYAKQPMEELAMTTIKRPYTQASPWWPFSLSAILPFLYQKDDEATENADDETFSWLNSEVEKRGLEAIKEGGNPNVRDKNGRTLLMVASLTGDLENLHTLIKAGADLNAKDRSGDTALHKAINTDKLESVRALIKAGADPNIKRNTGSTPLHIATRLENLPILHTLIEAGADVNTKDNNGQTPLMVAVFRGYKDHTNTLIQSGADVNAQDNNGNTVLSLAIKSPFSRNDIINALREAGAKEYPDNAPKSWTEWAYKQLGY